ncbi:MAG: hypothetical protein U0800_21315, partial [Isosphaeraceae bacterium]
MPIAIPCSTYSNGTSDGDSLTKSHPAFDPGIVKAINQFSGSAKDVGTELWMGWVHRTSAVSRLDKSSTLRALDQLKSLGPNWNGYNATSIDRQLIQAARQFIISLPNDIAPTPKVVPMTKGRLQFEWHR